MSTPDHLQGLNVLQHCLLVGAILVVDRFAHRVRLQQGDHKGRPYVILRSLLTPILSDWLMPGDQRGRNRWRPARAGPFKLCRRDP